MTDLLRWWPAWAPDLVRIALEKAYAEPTRSYHDITHLTEVLTRLDELASAGTQFDVDAVRLAAWFHDSVYDGQPGAEERSARWAERELHASPIVEEVARLVRLTERHRATLGDDNGAALCDADLAILAADPARYRAYAAAVRKEYAAVPDEAFAAGRSAILRDLLEQPTLFRTQHALDHWEAIARANMAAELTALAR